MKDPTKSALPLERDEKVWQVNFFYEQETSLLLGTQFKLKYLNPGIFVLVQAIHLHTMSNDNKYIFTQ